MRLVLIGAAAAVLVSQTGCGTPESATINNKNPEVSITAPTEGEAFKPLTAVPLEGIVSDPNPGDSNNYPKFTVQWTITGTLYDGSRYSDQPSSPPPGVTGVIQTETEPLEVGEYVVELQVWDTHSGPSAVASRQFSVVNQVPEIDAITCPTERLEVAPEAEVDICGKVTDPDDPEDSLTIALSDSLEEPYYFGTNVAADGSFKVTVTFSTPGTHNVYVIVSDPNGGHTDGGPVTVDVRACCPYDTDGDGISGCDGDCDEPEECVDTTYDADKDGFPGCDPVHPDCNDLNATIHPGASEGCDSLDTDCDGELGVNEIDSDGDAMTSCDGDCDDTDPNSYEGASEVCDGRDNDCNGAIPSVEGDIDDDGYLDVYCSKCTAPALCGDCNDNNPSVHPGAPEICSNSIDDNCNSQVDENSDRDADGFSTCSDCSDEQLEAGFTDCSDCDDEQPLVYPNAAEGPDQDGDGIPDCDGLDNDCDGSVDEWASCVDDDGDGVTDLEGDCDDNAFYTYPGAMERPDFQDNDCDGAIEGALTGAAAHVKYAGNLAFGAIGAAISGSSRNYSDNTDVNGDKFSDIIVGSPSYDAVYQGQYRGAAFILFGADQGWAEQDNMEISTAGIMLYEEDTGSSAGYAVTMAGDLNGDGFGDFAVGAPKFALPSRSNVGRAYIIFGKATGWGTTTLTAASYAVLEGVQGSSTENTRVGHSMAGGGDVNDDGFDDLLIGAPWAGESNEARGWVMVVPGKSSGWSTDIKPNQLSLIYGKPDMVIGRALAIGGRINSDGIEDILIGGLNNVEMNNGSATLIFGDPGFDEGTAYSMDDITTNTYYASSPDAYAAESLSGRIDINNDALDDILVGKRDSLESENLAYVLLGDNTWPADYSLDYVADIVLTKPAEGTNECPCQVQGIGDMNGDGYGDFAVGIPKNSDDAANTGKVYVFYGRESTEAWGIVEDEETEPSRLEITDADLVLSGENEGDEFGTALAASDLNADGWQDLIISAPYWDSESQEDVGRIYVIFGYPPEHNPHPW